MMLVPPREEDSTPGETIPQELESESLASSSKISTTVQRRVKPRAFDPDSPESMGPVAKCPDKFAELSSEPGERFHQQLVNALPPLTGDIIRSSFRMKDADANAAVIDSMNGDRVTTIRNKNTSSLDYWNEEQAAEIKADRERFRKLYREKGGLNLGALAGLMIDDLADRTKANPFTWFDEAGENGDVHVPRTIMNLASLMRMLGYDEGTGNFVDLARCGPYKPTINFERARRVVAADSHRTNTQELFTTAAYVGDTGNLQYAISELTFAYPCNPDADEKPVLKDDVVEEPPRMRADWIRSMRQAYRGEHPFERASTSAASHSEPIPSKEMEETTPTEDKATQDNEMESEDSL